MTERIYQPKIIKRLREEFPGCVILKNDSRYMQGVPDLIVLYGPYWAMLEVKASARSSHQPNQDHWTEVLDDMGYAAFIFPENEDEVFRDLQHAFKPRRHARVS